MLLCVDLQALPIDSKRVQRNVDLVDIVNNHTRLFLDREEAAKANFAPLNFCTSVRSTYTNTVVSTECGGKTLYYTNMTNVGEFHIKGEDLIMYVSSLGVLSLCDMTPKLYEVMLKYSVFQPIGLANIDPDFIDPMVYSHIVLSDEGMTMFSECLKPQNKVCPIQSINPSGNIKALLDTLIIVKEEDKNA